MTPKFLSYLLAIGIPSILALYQYSSTKLAEHKIKTLQTQLETLEIESQVFSENAEKSATKAKNDMRYLQAKTNRILKFPIPKDCTNAMRWSLSQAELLE
jgi:hypothetical protein